MWVVLIIDSKGRRRIKSHTDPLESSPVHIALYSPNWPPAGAANGIVSYVSTVRNYLIEQGHRVSILSEGTLHTDDDREIPLLPSIEQLRGLDRLKHRISRRVDSWHGALPGIGLTLAEQVRAMHRIAPVDIFEMEESFGWSRMVRQRTRIPTVTRLHGPYFLKPEVPRTPSERRSDLQRCRAEGRAVRSTATLTAPTRAIMNVTCQNYQRPPQTHDSIIPNPIRLAPEQNRWSLEGCDRNHILMVGRFEYAKGADTMLLAFEHVLRKHPNARLTLVGPKIGIATGEGQLADFEEFARANLSPETAARVTLTGTLTPPEIALLRKQAIVTVIASRLENFPYALLEGLAAGCPMISTDWPGSDEIISDGETGLLTPVGDAEAMADRIVRLLDHPEMAASIGVAGMRHCADAFSIETIGRRLVECYEATLQTI